MDPLIPIVFKKILQLILLALLGSSKQLISNEIQLNHRRSETLNYVVLA